MVKDYVDKLTQQTRMNRVAPAQIGVITPYNKQASLSLCLSLSLSLSPALRTLCTPPVHGESDGDISAGLLDSEGSGRRPLNKTLAPTATGAAHCPSD